MDLAFRRLAESEIDPGETTFCVRRRHLPALGESIARSGIRSPLIVERLGSRHRIVSGRGRWESRPRDEPLPCFILPEALPLESVWEVFLRDNEEWNVIEIARILSSLSELPGLSVERMVAEKLPLMGLHASADVYRRHVKLLSLTPATQEFIEEEGLPLRRAAAFFKLPPEAIDRVLACARELRFSLNELGEILEWLEEAAHREGTSAAEVLAELRSGARGSKDALRRALRERRFPELSRYRAAIEAVEKRLRFSVPVRVEWDSCLERPGIRLIADLADEEAAGVFERELAENRDVLRGFFEVL